MKKLILNIMGWIGVLFVLGAYALNVFNVIHADSVFYLSLNIVGSIFILLEAFSKKDYQPAFLNLVWAGIALVVLIKLTL